MGYPILNGQLDTVVFEHRRGHMPQWLSQADQVAYKVPIDAPLYYEVIQLRGGLPLFYHDHIKRLQKTLNLAQQVWPTMADVHSDLGHFLLHHPMLVTKFGSIEARAKACNNWIRLSDPITNQSHVIKPAPRMDSESMFCLKFVCTEDVLLVYLMDIKMPAPEQFDSGSNTGIVRVARLNPQIKQIRGDYKAAIEARFRQNGPYGAYDELLLVDDQGFITEGSRSNVFFMKHDVIVTPPAELALRGITKQYVFKAIEAAQLILNIEPVSVDAVLSGDYHGGFLTSTVFDILPIRSVEAQCFDPNASNLLTCLRHHYERLVRQDYERLVRQNIDNWCNSSA